MRLDITALLLTLTSTIAAPANAALQGRDLDGNSANGYEAYYDSHFNITWLADANSLAKAINALPTAQARADFVDGIIQQVGVVQGHVLARHDFDLFGDFTSSGVTTWWAAQAWATSAMPYGISGWRLPQMVDLGAPGCSQLAYLGTDCGWNVNNANAELAHMYAVTLERPSAKGPNGESWPAYGIPNEVAMPIPGLNGGLIYNLKSDGYWYGTRDASADQSAWAFHFTGGRQDTRDMAGGNQWNRTWLVREGDVSPVPEPSQLMFLVCGLLAFAVARADLKKRERTK